MSEPCRSTEHTHRCSLNLNGEVCEWTYTFPPEDAPIAVHIAAQETIFGHFATHSAVEWATSNTQAVNTVNRMIRSLVVVVNEVVRNHPDADAALGRINTHLTQLGLPPIETYKAGSHISDILHQQEQRHEKASLYDAIRSQAGAN